MRDDPSAGTFDRCVREIVESRHGKVEDVTFEPNGRWARVRFSWGTYEDKLAILFDLEADEVHDLLSAEEMDALRLR